MNNEAKKTEQLIQIYREDMAEENFKALLYQMKKTMFFVPALLPDTPEVNEMKQKVKDNPGQQIKLPKGVSPIPAILTNQNGGKFFPVYSSREQIPKEPAFDLLMQVPFQGACAFALDARLETQGLVLNPFTDNLMFGRALIEKIKKEESGMQQASQPEKLTPQQYQIRMRQKAEFHDLPLRIFQEGEELIQKISDEGEAVVNEIYRNTFQQKELYPYEEHDFSVMALNISEELLLMRIDLPMIKAAAQLCHRVYVTYNPKNSETHYFTIEQGRGKNERNLGEIDAQAKRTEHGEAPVEGAEIQRIMELVK